MQNCKFSKICTDWFGHFDLIEKQSQLLEKKHIKELWRISYLNEYPPKVRLFCVKPLNVCSLQFQPS